MHREREVPNSGYRFDSGNTLRQDAVTSAVFLAVKTSRYRCLAPLYVSAGSQTHRMTYATSVLKLSDNAGKTPPTADQRRVGEFRSFSKFRRSVDPS